MSESEAVARSTRHRCASRVLAGAVQGSAVLEKLAGTATVMSLAYGAVPQGIGPWREHPLVWLGVKQSCRRRSEQALVLVHEKK